MRIKILSGAVLGALMLVCVPALALWMFFPTSSPLQASDITLAAPTSEQAVKPAAERKDSVALLNRWEYTKCNDKDIAKDQADLAADKADLQEDQAELSQHTSQLNSDIAKLLADINAGASQKQLDADRKQIDADQKLIKHDTDDIVKDQKDIIKDQADLQKDLQKSCH